MARRRIENVIEVTVIKLLEIEERRLLVASVFRKMCVLMSERSG
jgi:hypothetical protein